MPDPIVPPAVVAPPVTPPATTPVPTPPVVPGVEPDESKLGDPGKAALKVERDARTKAETELADAKAALQKIEDAKLSDVQRAQKERDDQATENAKLKADNARLAALAKHPVPEDYQDLVTGTDAASFEAAAKKISELYARAEQKHANPSTSAIARTNATQKTDDYDTAIADARAARNFPLAISLQQQRSAALAERKD